MNDKSIEDGLKLMGLKIGDRVDSSASCRKGGIVCGLNRDYPGHPLVFHSGYRKNPSILIKNSVHSSCSLYDNSFIRFELEKDLTPSKPQEVLNTEPPPPISEKKTMSPNDALIEKQLADKGFKVGDKVRIHDPGITISAIMLRNNPNLFNIEATVVGIICGVPVIHSPKFLGGFSKVRKSLHSDFDHLKLDSGELLDMYPECILRNITETVKPDLKIEEVVVAKDTTKSLEDLKRISEDDVAIDKLLSNNGFKVGDKIYCNANLPGGKGEGVIVGAQHNGFLTVKMLGIKGAYLNKKSYTINSKYHSELNDGCITLIAVSEISMLNDKAFPGPPSVASNQPAVNSSLSKEQADNVANDEKIKEGLHKLGMKVGDSYYTTRLFSKDAECTIVGLHGTFPLVQIVGSSDSPRFPLDKKYHGTSPLVQIVGSSDSPRFPLYKKYTDSRYQGNRSVAFSISELKSKESYLREENDKSIEKSLKDIGFSLGEEIEYLVDDTDTILRYPNPKHKVPLSTTKHIGKIVGYDRGPVISVMVGLKNSWSTRVSSPFKACIHSRHRSNDVNFCFIDTPSIRKINNVDSILSDTEKRLDEIDSILLKLSKNPSPPLVEEKKESVTPTQKTLPQLFDIEAPIVYRSKSLMKKAGYRIIAKQAVNLSQRTLIFSMKKSGASNKSIKKISDMLNSEYGKAIISIVFGIALDNEILKTGCRSKLQELFITDFSRHKIELAKEFRVGGMTIAGNEIIETIFSSALNSISNSEQIPAKEEFQILDQTIEEESFQKESSVF